MYEPEPTAAAYRLGHLARALRAAGFEVEVLTSRSPNERRSTPDVKRWPVLRDRSGAVRGYVQYLSFDVPLFFRLLFAKRADVVVVEPPPTTGLAARLACGIRRIPYVYFSADVTSSALEAVKPHPVVKRAVRWMEQHVLRRARHVLAVSEGVKDQLRALGVDDADVTVVGIGIDTERFAAYGAAESPGHRYLIYTGTMSEVHGAEVFVRGFEAVADSFPDVHLYMFGGGVEVEALKRRAEPISNRVHFPGVISAERTAAWIRGAVAALASVRPGRGYDFAFPTKALSSLSCGTPVIFAGVGPARAIIPEADAGWVTDWDAEQVASAMLAALSAPSPRLSEQQVAWVDEQYSLEAAANRGAAAITAALHRR
ncbi:glycosyltransferase family 4 protein [Ruicaihuangia caeni]|uniref:glycosyltransferase family 4 protein n=1 Tax=Ruicaihuangia caeni TaxID=3042517 RepID=UPI00338E2BDB